MLRRANGALGRGAAQIRCCTSKYEDVVANLEGSVRRILDFCELEFEPACINFYKTGRSVRTASSEQVRQPIFKEGLEQWRHFEPYLGPLRKELGLLAVPAMTPTTSAAATNGHGGSTP